MEERLERANQLLDEIAEGCYGWTLDDSIQWGIEKYFDDIAKEDDGNRYNLVKQRVDREKWKWVTSELLDQIKGEINRIVKEGKEQ